VLPLVFHLSQTLGKKPLCPFLLCPLFPWDSDRMQEDQFSKTGPEFPFLPMCSLLLPGNTSPHNLSYSNICFTLKFRYTCFHKCYQYKLYWELNSGPPVSPPPALLFEFCFWDSVILPALTQLASNLWFPYLHSQTAGISGMHHHAWNTSLLILY
jgi:hypothetical protein